MVPSRYARGAVEVRAWYGPNAVEVQYARGVVEVRSRCTLMVRRAVEVCSWYGLGVVEVRSWCASGSMRFVNFSTGDTVLGVGKA